MQRLVIWDILEIILAPLGPLCLLHLSAPLWSHITALWVPSCSHCRCEALAEKEVKIPPERHSGHSAKHPQSYFLLLYTFLPGCLWIILLVLFFISVGHNRALRKEIKTFVCFSSPKLVHSFPGGSVVKNPPASAGDEGSSPGSGRCPGEGNGNLLQYSCPGNPMDRGGWRATVRGVSKSQTWT